MPFRATDLLDTATRENPGLEDFGSNAFRAGLEALCETYARAPLSEAGARRAQRRLIGLLGTRLRVAATLARHPEIRERRIGGPLVLTGLPRSGTTALFNLLACDAAARPLLFWETSHPDPAAGLEAGAPDPRRAAIVDMIDRHRTRNPDFDAMHFTDADAPEECVLLQGFGFHGVQLGIEPLLEPYATYFREVSPTPMYRDYADAIRMLDWQRPGTRWLLKSPAHLWALEELVAVFPDARIVWNHRDPVAVIPSMASITSALAQTMGDFEPQRLGPKVLEFYATSLERGLRSRERLGEDRFFDVDYDRLVATPLESVASLYDAFGFDLGRASRDAMARHLAAHPQGKHGRHAYDLASFALDREAIEHRFAGIPGLRADAGSERIEPDIASKADRTN
jgi:hypothetical protein